MIDVRYSKAVIMIIVATNICCALWAIDWSLYQAHWVYDLI